MNEPDLATKLDRALGMLEAMSSAQTVQANGLVSLAERMASVEQGVKDTKEVVEAWTAAKTGFRFIKWFATFVAAVAAAAAVFKGWLHR